MRALAPVPHGALRKRRVLAASAPSSKPAGNVLPRDRVRSPLSCAARESCRKHIGVRARGCHPPCRRARGVPQSCANEKLPSWYRTLPRWTRLKYVSRKENGTYLSFLRLAAHFFPFLFPLLDLRSSINTALPEQHDCYPPFPEPLSPSVQRPQASAPAISSPFLETLPPSRFGAVRGFRHRVRPENIYTPPMTTAAGLTSCR